MTIGINGGGIATTPGDPLYRGIGREVNEALGYRFTPPSQAEAIMRAAFPDVMASVDRIKKEKGWL